MQCNRKKTYTIVPGVIEYGNDSNLVLVSNKTEDDRVLVLNSSSKDIYCMIKNGKSVIDIVTFLAEKYLDTLPSVIEEDVNCALQVLLENEVIVENEDL